MHPFAYEELVRSRQADLDDLAGVAGVGAPPRATVRRPDPGRPGRPVALLARGAGRMLLAAGGWLAVRGGDQGWVSPHRVSSS
jgi:hypothetical protein